MYNREAVDSLAAFIKSVNGVGSKSQLEKLVKERFSLTEGRSLFWNDSFAIRFAWNGKNNSKSVPNTVLGLEKIRQYDSIPLILCIVTRDCNHLLLINTTFLKKVSHSSKMLRMDNIRGSINCSDIMKEFNGLENCPENFEQLFAFHSGLPFEDNLERLVEATNGIIGRPGFVVSNTAETTIYQSVQRSIQFVQSDNFGELKRDLDERVSKVQNEITIAALIENVNLRGRIIEYLITNNQSTIKEQIIAALKDGSPIPNFKTNDGLGDYTRVFQNYRTETDIKTKILCLSGNPKAYNVDKLLAFLAEEKTVYLIYLIGIDGSNITVRLCSVFDKRLLTATSIVHHWAGKNSRGVAQFLESGLDQVLTDRENDWEIDPIMSENYLNHLIHYTKSN